jgi:hypothetical protein
MSRGGNNKKQPVIFALVTFYSQENGMIDFKFEIHCCCAAIELLRIFEN